jgi:hypothetical protein
VAAPPARRISARDPQAPFITPAGSSELFETGEGSFYRVDRALRCRDSYKIAALGQRKSTPG